MRLARVSAIFRKELVDILRDRRTLVGMVVVPIVLYPALILTFGPAQLDQAEAMRRGSYVIVVPNAKQGRWLDHVIEGVYGKEPDPNDPTPTRPAASQPDPNAEAELGERPRVVLLDPKEFDDPNQAVRAAREYHVAVAFEGDPNAWRDGTEPVHVRIVYDERDLRSLQAGRRTEEMFVRFAEHLREKIRDDLARRISAPRFGERLDVLLQPIEMTASSVAASSMFLQIMPVILVLMTVTGAIYPAIDLTAGERERGTLETLMVTPVPTLEIVTGKFLVVNVVALITALLNVVSIGASVRIVHVDESMQLPIGHLLITLAAIVPLSMLFSAALIAVCSFARSFKESQNYVMPVVIAALVPAVMGSLPGVTLTGFVRVMPVQNIVVLVRELVTRDAVPWPDVVIVLLSTLLYACGAIAVASRLFGHEAVTFADAGSYRALFRRRFFRPRRLPTAPQALLTVAVLFPIWFHVQGIITSATATGEPSSFVWTTLWMVPTLALPPLALAIYLKIDSRSTFSLRPGRVRGWLAAVLIGLGTWALAIEFHALQQKILPMPESLREALAQADRAINDLPLVAAVLCVGLLPAVCEELLFRGWLLAGLRERLGKGWALVGVALVFSLYHGLIYRIPITALLGLVLAYLCWQSGSIFPAILAHAMHNASVVVISRSEAVREWLGLNELAQGRLPMHVWVPALTMVIVGVILLASVRLPAPGERDPVAR